MTCILISLACILYISITVNADPGIQKFDYESKGKRDPFVPLIGQEKAKGSGLENILSINDVALEGIAVGSKGKNAAILNGQMVKENEVFGVVRIKKISRKSVIISIEGKDYTLDAPGTDEGFKGGV